jgi:hypothetical protein
MSGKITLRQIPLFAVARCYRPARTVIRWMHRLLHYRTVNRYVMIRRRERICHSKDVRLQWFSSFRWNPIRVKNTHALIHINSQTVKTV